jgi:hypothetical protein
MFGGGTTNSTTNSETIRALEKKLACNNNNTLPTSEAKAFEFIAKKGDTKVIFAFPHDTRYNGTLNIYNKTPKF